MPAFHGRPVASLATYINGYPFRPDSFTVDGAPVVRIKQLNDPSVELDRYAGIVPRRHHIDTGDLIFSWSGSLSVVIWDRGPAYLNQHLFKVIPAPGVDRQWLRYALAWSLALFAPYMHGSAMTHITQPMMRQVRIPTPAIDYQRRIASFLDDQVARIDNIIAARRRQLTLLADESQASLDVMFSETASRTTRLGRFVAQIEQGWSPQCEAIPAGDHEWGVTKVSAVRPGQFDERENKRLPDDLRPQRAYEIKPGDLLVTRANTPALVGAFAVAPDHVRPLLILSDKIMRVVLTDGLEPRYVALFGQTSVVRKVLSGSGTGTSQSMVNIRGSDIRDLSIPVLDLPTQIAMARSRSAEVQAYRRHERLLSDQTKLLAELKRSLITAAVTGEFDVSSADGSQVPVG